MVASHWGFALIGIFFWMIVLAAMVAVIVIAIRLLTGPGRPMPPAGYTAPPGGPSGMPPATPRETPLEILARRFASGEITAEEYQKARDLLQGGPNPPPS